MGSSKGGRTRPRHQHAPPPKVLPLKSSVSSTTAGTPAAGVTPHHHEDKASLNFPQIVISNAEYGGPFLTELRVDPGQRKEVKLPACLVQFCVDNRFGMACKKSIKIIKQTPATPLKPEELLQHFYSSEILHICTEEHICMRKIARIKQVLRFCKQMLRFLLSNVGSAKRCVNCSSKVSSKFATLFGKLICSCGGWASAYVGW